MSRGAKDAPIKIIVDVHERQSGIAATLTELGAQVEVAPLPAGDYAVGADTLVERKRVLDLHAAVLKGRLWRQLGKLRAACTAVPRTSRHMIQEFHEFPPSRSGVRTLSHKGRT